MSRSFVTRAAILVPQRPGRAARLEARLAGDTLPRIADVGRLPEWVGWDAERRCRVFQAAALLSCRPLLDQEIDGSRLQAIADQCGEQLFDAACDADTDITASPASPDAFADLAGFGRAIVERSAPPALSAYYPTACSDKAAASLAAAACQLVQQAERAP